MLLLYCKQALRPHTFMFFNSLWIILKAHGRRAPLNRNFWNLFFFLLMKKRMSTRSHERKKHSVYLSLSLWVKTVELITFEIIWIWLHIPLKSLIQMKQWRNKRFMSKRLFPDLCSHSFSDHPSCTKTVDKKSQNRVSCLTVADWK